MGTAGPCAQSTGRRRSDCGACCRERRTRRLHAVHAGGIDFRVDARALYRDLSFDVSRDLAPIGFVGEQPLALAVRPSVGVNSLKELIAISRQQPAKLNLATITPVGSLPSLAGELLRARSGAQITSVPYPGTAEAISDISVWSGSNDHRIAAWSAGLVSDGKLKILAFTSPQRL